MEPASLTPVVADDAAAVTEVVLALESSLYGHSAFSQADLEDEWSELDVERDARVGRDGDRIVGYEGYMPGRGSLELLRRSVDTRCRVTPKLFAICSIVRPSA